MIVLVNVLSLLMVVNAMVMGNVMKMDYVLVLQAGLARDVSANVTVGAVILVQVEECVIRSMGYAYANMDSLAQVANSNAQVARPTHVEGPIEEPAIVLADVTATRDIEDSNVNSECVHSIVTYTVNASMGSVPVQVDGRGHFVLVLIRSFILSPMFPSLRSSTVLLVFLLPSLPRSRLRSTLGLSESQFREEEVRKVESQLEFIRNRSPPRVEWTL